MVDGIHVCDYILVFQPPSIGSANMSQLTVCLYELMGEVRSIKNDLKKVKKKKLHSAVSMF